MNPFRSAISCACCGSMLRLNLTRKELVNTFPAPPVPNLLPLVATTRQLSSARLATIRQHDFSIIAYEDTLFTLLVQIISLNPIFMGCFTLYICVRLLQEIGMMYTVATGRTQSFFDANQPVYVCMRGKFRFKNQ